MALRPDEFYDHALAAADGERRLPLARMTGWEISPFEQDGLRVAPLRPPVLPEPARHGEDPSDCRSCRNRDDGIWFNDRWRLTRIARSRRPAGAHAAPARPLRHGGPARRAGRRTWGAYHPRRPPRGGAAAHRPGPRVPHRGRRRAPARLVLRPARGTGAAATGRGWSSGTTCCRSTRRTWPTPTRRPSPTRWSPPTAAAVPPFERNGVAGHLPPHASPDQRLGVLTTRYGH